jgi:hypothetical protein
LHIDEFDFKKCLRSHQSSISSGYVEAVEESSYQFPFESPKLLSEFQDLSSNNSNSRILPELCDDPLNIVGQYDSYESAHTGQTIYGTSHVNDTEIFDSMLPFKFGELFEDCTCDQMVIIEYNTSLSGMIKQ